MKFLAFKESGPETRKTATPAFPGAEAKAKIVCLYARLRSIVNSIDGQYEGGLFITGSF